MINYLSYNFRDSPDGSYKIFDVAVVGQRGVLEIIEYKIRENEIDYRFFDVVRKDATVRIFNWGAVSYTIKNNEQKNNNIRD